MTIDKGETIAGNIVSELTNFIGTISRNPRFINMMCITWHEVPKDSTKRMREYINVREINFEIVCFMVFLVMKLNLFYFA